jgi:penicillin-binding protein 2
VLLILVLVVAAILSGAIIGGGQSPSTIYNDLRDRVASVIDRDGGDDTPSGPEQPVAQSTAPADQPQNDPAAQGSTPVANAAQTGGVNTDDPLSVAREYGRLWAAADYDGMYDLLSAPAQGSIARQEFVDRYTAIGVEAGLTSVAMTASEQLSLDAEIPISVVMQSSYVGEITQDNIMPMIRESGGWRVNWTPSLIFAGLDNDCVDYAADTVERGAILDRNREPLALDDRITQVGVIPGQITDEDLLLETLSELLDMPQDEIKEKYDAGEPDWFMPIKDYPAAIDTETLNGLQGLGGVVIQSGVSRVYPLAEQAAHITGYVTRATADDIAADESGTLLPDQWVGRAGVEAAANDILAGVPGGRLRIVDCGARTEKELIAERATVPGKDIILTVDISLQQSVDKALTAEKGSAVVLDPRNGEILALVSHPTYNPNWFVLGFNSKDWDYVNDEDKRPLFNRATEATYPTGSIFKVITMAAGLADLGLTGTSEFDCPATWSIPGTDAVFRDWTVAEGVAAQGRMTLHNALVTSCNTIFYQLGYELDQQDNELLPAMARAFGLGSPTGIPYYYEAAGTVPDPQWKQETVGDYWATGDAINLSIGQGYLLATPLQMAVAYAAIANGGNVMQPYLVEYTADQDTGKRERIGTRTVASELPLADEQVREIQSALRDQASNDFGAGSARLFADYDYPIAGKTGTAQNDLDRNQTPHSWFAAFGPYGERATVTTIVMAESAGEGISVAAPITKTIFDAYRKTDLAEQ